MTYPAVQLYQFPIGVVGLNRGKSYLERLLEQLKLLLVVIQLDMQMLVLVGQPGVLLIQCLDLLFQLIGGFLETANLATNAGIAGDYVSHLAGQVGRSAGQAALDITVAAKSANLLLGQCI